MISDEVYENSKILVTSNKDYDADSRTWYNRATSRHIPSVIVLRKTKFSTILVDADPLSGSYLGVLLKNKERTVMEVDNLLKPLFKNYNRGKTICSIFSVPNKDAEGIANSLYEIYLKAMN